VERKIARDTSAICRSRGRGGIEIEYRGSESELSSGLSEMSDTGTTERRKPDEKTFGQLLGDFQQRLETELDDFLRGRIESAAAFGESTRELTEPLREFVGRGGKRLRPALVHFACRAAGGERKDLSVEMAVELLHTYLLIHDDIMDRAESRRGGISAHRHFEGHHRTSGWHGSAERHGEAAAILLGDLASSYATGLFLSSSANPRHDGRVSRCFSEMCSEVVVGQYLEITAPQRADLVRDDLLSILRLKSGRYSVERPIQLGALLGSAPDDLLDALSRYGLALGEAFQLQDDLLGVFGNREEVGKPVGGDLSEGKRTILVSLSLDRASESEREAIVACLQRENPPGDEIDRVQEIIERVGARRTVEDMVGERLERSAAELETMELLADGRIFFGGLIDYLRERRS
jgi:geranylgeranyl diphosphate synthase type I